MKIVSTLFVVSIATLAAINAEAQTRVESTYPDKPIRLVVGFAAGGATDVIARIFANRMSAELGQPVVVENKTGASGLVATEAVANAPPDGYTILHVTTEYVINQSLRKNLSFSPASFKPVSAMAHSNMFLVASPQLKVNSLSDLIKLANAHA